MPSATAVGVPVWVCVCVVLQLHCMNCCLTIFITGFCSSILAGQLNGLPLHATASQPHTHTLTGTHTHTHMYVHLFLHTYEMCLSGFNICFAIVASPHTHHCDLSPVRELTSIDPTCKLAICAALGIEHCDKLQFHFYFHHQI